MKYKCPCCGYKTLTSRGEYDICPVCFWEDDPFQDECPDCAGGANSVDLVHAKNNFASFGACEERFIKEVRKPLADE